jgi:CheY-like chemotaxis protein
MTSGPSLCQGAGHFTQLLFCTVSEKKRILVADDSETIRALLQTALESAGYEVDMAKDGLSAYELGSNGDYDLIILDQLMPTPSPWS